MRVSFGLFGELIGVNKGLQGQTPQSTVVIHLDLRKNRQA